MHRLLERQLKRYIGESNVIPAAWQNFLQAVDEAYCQFDDDRTMLERSLELSSRELLQANTQLQALLKTVETQVAERTEELTQTNAELERTLIDLQQTQMQLIQAEKMSSLGQLVAGIAHEINNPISFIHGNLSYLRSYVNNLLAFIRLHRKHYPCPTPEVQVKAEEIDLEFMQEDLLKLLNSMTAGTDRIREIVLSLRNFSRLDEAEFKTANIHEGLDNTLLILQHRLKAKSGYPEIQVTKHYSDLPLIECHPGQLNQVFASILTNAIDAVEEARAKQTAQQIAENPSCISIRTTLLDAEWVEIAIANNGVSIPESIQSKIFNPFFTTKPVGKGTGMGMAIGYQIINEKHGGKLTCFSTPETGTEFVIQIPVQQQVFSDQD